MGNVEITIEIKSEYRNSPDLIKWVETISNYPNANVKTRREMVAFMLRCLGHLKIGYLNLGIPAGMVRTNFDIRI